jgi:hypothetical protein
VWGLVEWLKVWALNSSPSTTKKKKRKKKIFLPVGRVVNYKGQAQVIRNQMESIAVFST